MYCLMLIPYRKKNVEPAPVARSTVYRPSHCPVRRNEQRGSAPRKVYLQRCSLTIGYKCGCTSSMICVITTPYKERSRCFVFDEQFEVAKFLHSQNQSVQKTPFSICSSLPTGKWSHEATIHLLKQFCAMMSVGRVCYAELLRLIVSSIYDLLVLVIILFFGQ